MNNRNFIFKCLLACLFVALILPGSIAHGQVYPDLSIPQNSDVGLQRSHGLKNAIYVVVYPSDQLPTSTQWTDKQALVRAGEVDTREYFSASTKGQFDIYYEDIIQVPLAIAGTERPADWKSTVKNYIANTLGINASDYYATVFDVHNTPQQFNQGWGGIYYAGTRDVAVQSTASSVFTHELGHRAGLMHPGSFSNGMNPYVWDATTTQYVSYENGVSPYTPTPYGMTLSMKGNPYGTMSGDTTTELTFPNKHHEMQLFTNDQVHDLGAPDPPDVATYRIYAHDESEVVSTSGPGTGGMIYGVANGYNENVLYGLTFQRQGENFNQNQATPDFVPVTQTIDIAYRSGRNGVLIYLDQVLVDFDPTPITSAETYAALELAVGGSVLDRDFGISKFHTIRDEDFLSFNPSPPTDSTVLRPETFEISVLNTGTDSIGSYIDVYIGLGNVPDVLGDLDADGDIDLNDWLVFKTNFALDTSGQDLSMQQDLGDLDTDGTIGLLDLVAFRDQYDLFNGTGAFANLGAVPEPGSVAMLGLAAVGILRRRR